MSNRRPHALFRMESRHCNWISGSFGLRDELAKVHDGGRPPVWSPRQHAFSVSEETARRALAALEWAGWDLVVEGPRPASPVTPVTPEPEPEETRLW